MRWRWWITSGRLSPEAAGQDGANSLGKTVDGKALRACAEVQDIEPNLARPVNRGGQGLPRAPDVLAFIYLVKDAVAAILHDVQHPAAPGGDDRRAAGERLDGRDPEVLDAGLDEAEGAAVEVAEALRRDLAQELDRPA